MYSNENIHGGDIYNHNIKDDFSVNINPLGTPYPLKDALREALEHVMVYPQQGSGKLIEHRSKFAAIGRKIAGVVRQWRIGTSGSNCTCDPPEKGRDSGAVFLWI